MEIIYDEYPPNYKKIAKTFNIKGRTNIVFTYGDKLYVPGGRTLNIDQPLLRHEETHARRQAEMGVEAWYERYLADPGFRFMQELEAYRNQYRAMAELPFERRIGYLDHISSELAGEMYGNLVTKDEAKAEITKGIILKHVGGTKHKHLTIRKLKKRQRQNRKKGRR